MTHLGKGPEGLQVGLGNRIHQEAAKYSTMTLWQPVHTHAPIKKTQKLWKKKSWVCISPLMSFFSGCILESQWLFLLNFQQFYWNIIYHEWVSFCDCSWSLSYYLWWSCSSMGLGWQASPSEGIQSCVHLCLYLCVPVPKSMGTCVCGSLSYEVSVSVCVRVCISLWTCFGRF